MRQSLAPKTAIIRIHFLGEFTFCKDHSVARPTCSSIKETYDSHEDYRLDVLHFRLDGPWMGCFVVEV